MKKKIFLSMLIVLGVLLLAVISVLAVIIIKDQDLSTGRIIIADNGSYLLVNDSLTKMNNLSKEKDIFKDLTNGDFVIIGHTATAESYPAQTGVYWCIKIKNGERKDIPDNFIEDLYTMGWIKDKEGT